jgi:hypothetical protein
METEELAEMPEHEIRFYLDAMRKAIVDGVKHGDNEPIFFTPKYMVVAIELPNGAVELQINTHEIVDKIDYILENYDNDMKLRNAVGQVSVTILNILVV